MVVRPVVIGCALAVLAVTVTAAGCATPGRNAAELTGAARTNDLEELTRLHELARTAHVGKDAALLASIFSDDFINIQRGTITRPTREQSIARLQPYFNRSTFQAWDDISPPIIRISGDGTMAYVVVHKRVRLTAPRPDGSQDRQHVVYAWLETYEKRGGKWQLTTVTSTDAPGDTASAR